jgi:amino acid transporter
LSPPEKGRILNGMVAVGQNRLVRAIGRWTLTALVVNGIIGSGVFGLPDDVALLAGRAAPLAYLAAALGIGVIMACFAEVASRFAEAGGPYLYAREAFGRLAGIQMGWFAWLVRLTSAAANASLFVVYLDWFFRGATSTLPRAAILTVLIGLLAVVNIQGVRSGAGVSNVFTAAKLLSLAAFIVMGLAALGGRISLGGPGPTEGNWLQAVLVLIFAYGGFETALIPMAEAREPRRDAPFALFSALIVVTAAYLLVHLVVASSLVDPAALQRPEVRERPVAEAARLWAGEGGAGLIALAVLISTGGYLAGQFVGAPRLTFALAEQGDFPAIFAAVHPRSRTPNVSILIYSLLVWALALYGSFFWNAMLSAVARLFTYGLVCAALIRLRRKAPTSAMFRLPAGGLAGLAGIAFCSVMAAQMDRGHLKVVVGVAAIALANWFWVRIRGFARRI